MLSWMLLMGFNRETHGKGVRAVLSHCRLTDCRGVSELANLAFESVEEFNPDSDNTAGWPHACNFLFIKTAEFLAPRGAPFLWFEPDAVPLVPDFIGKLFTEYSALPTGMFLGCKKKLRIRAVPPREIDFMHSAIAIYPDPGSFVGQLIVEEAPWDAQISALFSDRLRGTSQIQDTAPIGLDFHTFQDLIKINRDAVAFHYAKNGDLIRVLTHRAVAVPAAANTSPNRMIVPPMEKWMRRPA
jgi:hypothetical protein